MLCVPSGTCCVVVPLIRDSPGAGTKSTPRTALTGYMGGAGLSARRDKSCLTSLGVNLRFWWHLLVQEGFLSLLKLS